MRFAFYTAVILAAPPALAQPQAQIDALAQIIEVTCIDVTDHIGCERLMLLKNPVETDTADLLILPDHHADDPDTPLLFAPEVAFNGALWGMAPRIEARGGGGFLLHSEQTAIGRTVWEQTLTIAYREDRFVVAGYTYHARDRMTRNQYLCDMNLLSGAYNFEMARYDATGDEPIVTRSSGKTAANDIALADWRAFGTTPAVCTRESAGFYDE